MYTPRPTQGFLGWVLVVLGGFSKLEKLFDCKNFDASLAFQCGFVPVFPSLLREGRGWKCVVLAQFDVFVGFDVVAEFDV